MSIAVSLQCWGIRCVWPAVDGGSPARGSWQQSAVWLGCSKVYSSRTTYPRQGTPWIGHPGNASTLDEASIPGSPWQPGQQQQQQPWRWLSSWQVSDHMTPGHMVTLPWRQVSSPCPGVRCNRALPAEGLPEPIRADWELWGTTHNIWPQLTTSGHNS